jgi:hypothetical protein
VAHETDTNTMQQKEGVRNGNKKLAMRIAVRKSARGPSPTISSRQKSLWQDMRQTHTVQQNKGQEAR